MKYIDEHQIEKDAKATWERNITVRQEFVSYETYLAYKKAEAQGSVKILGAK